MIRVALRSMAARRLRAALTALAIVLGIAMVSGTFILTDTIQRSFSGVFSESYSGTDLVVKADPPVQGLSGAPTVPADLLATIRREPGVAAAAGTLIDLSSQSNSARLLNAAGEPIGSEVAPGFAFGVDPGDARFNPLALTDGRWADGPDEVVIDAATAADHDVRIGQTVGVAAAGPVRYFTVTGLGRYGDAESLGGATMAFFDVPTAQSVLGKSGYDAIQVAAEPGTDRAELAQRIEAVVPAGVEVTSGAQEAARVEDEVAGQIGLIRGFLMAFAGIALFVGAFVIFNTFSITVAQRSRELATLRTLGASRRQVLGSVIAETAAIGLVASAVGLVAGFALAIGLTELFEALGATIPAGDTVFAARTVVVSLTLGVAIAVIAGVVPAVRATRVPPIAAVREGAVLPRGRVARATPALATVGTLGASGLLVLGVTGDQMGTSQRLGLLGGGAVLLFLGVAAFSPRLVRPLARMVGWPLARIGGASGELARQNATRNPSRTAATAAALMIGLALVTFVSVVGAGLQNSARTQVSDQLRADHVAAATGFGTIPAEVGETLADTPGVETVSGIRRDSALVAGSTREVSGVDPATIGAVYEFRWSAGDVTALDVLDRGGALISRSFADERNLTVGSALPITTPTGRQLRATVAGVFDAPRLASILGPVVIGQSDFDGAFPRAADIFALVATADGTDADALAAAVRPFPGVEVTSAEQFAESAAESLSTILNLLYVLLALSVLVSVFGMVNTMILSVHERTREIGMLRAVGMTRRQVRRMVRGESIVTALIGAALGLPIGLAIAALVTRALSQWDVALTIPVGTLLVFAGVAILVGVVAAVAPAARAGRLKVLDALHYE